jgi:transcription elongation factor Elf1
MSEGESDGQDRFECPKCGASWLGTYRIGLAVKQGKFDCQVCRAHVYVWNGVRDYFKWEGA